MDYRDTRAYILDPCIQEFCFHEIFDNAEITVWKNDKTLTAKCENCGNLQSLFWQKFLDAGIQDVSTSISIVHDLTEMSYGDDDDGDESDKHI